MAAAIGVGRSPSRRLLADAVGVHIRDLPITAEKVYRALTDNTQS